MLLPQVLYRRKIRGFLSSVLQYHKNHILNEYFESDKYLRFAPADYCLHIFQHLQINYSIKQRLHCLQKMESIMPLISLKHTAPPGY